MGLDFSIYSKDSEGNCEELAYGRKSWELVYELVPDFANYYEGLEWHGDPEVNLDSWLSLMGKLAEFAKDDNGFERAGEAFKKLNYAPDDFPELIITDDVKKTIAEYEYWYNKTFDTKPTLGYEFSVGYMSEFWNARDKVVERIKDPNYTVYADVSY